MQMQRGQVLTPKERNTSILFAHDGPIYKPPIAILLNKKCVFVFALINVLSIKCISQLVFLLRLITSCLLTLR